VARLLSLEGKIALVTGAAGGIGSSVVELMARAGAEVIEVDLPGRRPGAGRFEPCDVGDAGSVRDLYGRLQASPGRLDIMVHCAGIRSDAVLWKMEETAWTEVLRVNLDSAFHVLKRTVPLMRAGGGAIVLVSSINGQRGKFGLANYAASKAGLIGLGRTAARELGRFGIRVNLVAPGMVRTPLTATLPEKYLQEGIDESVLGRLGEPRDVAAAILFLCSGMSRHITGQVLRVDGGQLIA
jgi:acetoacetyl-CoA reductase/3-oxoacyl-[acyl-carrier protein] reductase